MKHNFLIIISALLVPSFAYADFGYSDSGEFGFEIITYSIDYADSTEFELDARHINRGSAESASFFFDADSKLSPGSLSWIGADKLHQNEITGSGVTVGVIEFGDPWSGHPALDDGRIIPGESIMGDADAHATAVCGILLGSSSEYAGIANGSFAFCQNSGQSEASMITAIENLILESVDLINFSVGSASGTDGTVAINAKLDDIIDNEKITVVCANGNIHGDDVTYSEIISPAESYNVISVAALEGAGSADNLYEPFESWRNSSLENITGPTAANGIYRSARCKPDIASPGECMATLLSNNEINHYAIISSKVDSYGVITEGAATSSYAAPHVSGTVALMIQAARDEGHFVDANNKIDPRVVKSALLTAADKSVKRSDGSSWRTAGSDQPLDYELGAGGLDAEKAVKVLLSQSDKTGLRASHMDHFDNTTSTVIEKPIGQLVNGSGVTITLCWNAHMGSELNSVTLHDLDIALIRNGQIIAQSSSNIDNVEHIYLPPGNSTVTEGDYSIIVEFQGVLPSYKEYFGLSYDVTSVANSSQFAGVNYTGWSAGEMETPMAALSLRQARMAGCDWVAINVFGFQDDVDSSVIYEDTNLYSQTESEVAKAIERSHNLGLKVMLKPMVDGADGSWRGNFNPGNVEGWFRSYRSYIVKWAQFAQQHGVDFFCVGCEYVKLADEKAQWERIIQSVRGVFFGDLTYAANHGNEANINWWDKLDYIGIDAYYSLSNDNSPSYAELEQAWSEKASEMESWLYQNWPSMKVLFTEAGYQSVDGTNRSPWYTDPGNGLDFGEQSDCYRALISQCASKDWWAGVLWWNWHATPPQDSMSDSDFTPQNKPAQDVMKDYYWSEDKALLLEQDLDADGVVDLNDMLIISEYWLNSQCNSISNCYAIDFDTDGIISLSDFAELSERWLEELE